MEGRVPLIIVHRNDFYVLGGWGEAVAIDDVGHAAGDDEFGLRKGRVHGISGVLPAFDDNVDGEGVGTGGDEVAEAVDLEIGFIEFVGNAAGLRQIAFASSAGASRPVAAPDIRQWRIR